MRVLLWGGTPWADISPFERSMWWRGNNGWLFVTLVFGLIAPRAAPLIVAYACLSSASLRLALKHEHSASAAIRTCTALIGGVLLAASAPVICGIVFFVSGD